MIRLHNLIISEYDNPNDGKTNISVISKLSHVYFFLITWIQKQMLELSAGCTYNNFLKEKCSFKICSITSSYFKNLCKI